MTRVTSGWMLPLALGAVFAAPLACADTERGRLLYENHCQGCHVSAVHVREQRKVVTTAELQAFILRWSSELKLSWQDSERADVFQYLNSRYYKFPATGPAK